MSELTGQTISHTAAWNVVQRLGQRLDKQEQEALAQAAKDEDKGMLESPVLFEEMDGIYLKLQGKSRKEHGSSKEMKVAIAYDGADWIKDSMVDDTHFQLDHFHISQAITRYVSDDEARKNIRNWLYSKQIDQLLAVIEAYANSTGDEKERENYNVLLRYFQNNKDGLIPCHRRGTELTEPLEGKEYRRMGAMESNIFTIIGNRMKSGRACWSIEGGNNLARLLCLKATGKLSAASIHLREGKGYNRFHKMSVPASLPLSILLFISNYVRL